MMHVTCRLTAITGISSGTLRSLIDYGLPLPFLITTDLRGGWEVVHDVVDDAAGGGDGRRCPYVRRPRTVGAVSAGDGHRDHVLDQHDRRLKRLLRPTSLLWHLHRQRHNGNLLLYGHQPLLVTSTIAACDAVYDQRAPSAGICTDSMDQRHNGNLLLRPSILSCQPQLIDIAMTSSTSTIAA